MKKRQAARPVVVTTAHRGVFFGYTDDADGEQVALTRSRLCIYWSADVQGFTAGGHHVAEHHCRSRSDA